MSTAYIVLPLLVFIINIFLAGLVVRSNWSSLRHRVFAAFLTGMALWGLTIFGMRSSPNLEAAFIWEKAALSVIPLAGVLFFHFSLRFTYTRFSNGTLMAIYAMVGVMAALSISGLVASEMQQKWYGYAPVLGPLFLPWLLAAYLPIVLAFTVLVKARKRSRSAEEKVRISYIIVAAAASVIGGTTDYLPALGLNIYPLGIVANILFGVLTTFAVIRYQLVEVRSMLRRGFTYSVLSSTIFAAYGTIFFIFSIVFRNQTTSASIVAAVGALILMTIVLPPAIGRVQRWVDRLFFRERYDHLEALQRFTSETRDISDFAGLANSLTNTVSLAMQANWVVLLLPKPESEDFEQPEETYDPDLPELCIRRTSPIARWLAKNDRALQIQDLELDPYLLALGDASRMTFQRAGAQIFVPLKAKGELTGILVLGPRLVEAGYTRGDIELLATVARQAAIIIENARLYNQEMARLAELEQLETLKSTLLRTVSHELKSPLTAIKTSVDLLSSNDHQLEEKTKARLMRALRSGVDRFERLVDESLDYAQMQSAQLELRLELTDLSKIADDAMGLVGPAINAKRQIATVDISPNLPELLVDVRRIERVFLNLLSNANKYAPVGGEISLRIWQEGTKIVAEVSDNGIGIPEEEQEHLFHEFYRGNQADRQDTPGTGLGLSISRYLVELHGGEIDFKRGPAAGATFYFTLPVASALELELAGQDQMAQPNRIN